MLKSVSVDRDEELALLDAMLTSQTLERILLICAESGWGKSILLREFEHRRPAHIPFVKLDFKSCTGLTETFSHLCDALGWDHFPYFKAAIRAFVQPIQISIEHNVLVGQNQIALALGGPDEQTREARRSDLTNAFFADLRALGELLLLFDTFERGDETVKSWLTSSFLPRAHRSPQLFVVVAGQRVPEQAFDWECCDLPLGPIAPEHWLIFAQSLGIQELNLELIRNCWHTHHGHTLRMAEALQAFAPQERRR